MIPVAVIGASGYLGGEAVRLLLGHPVFELTAVTARENAGRRLDEVMPNLRGFTDLVIGGDAPGTGDRAPEAFVLCLPHGGAMDLAPRLAGRVVDLSGDFRLRDADVFETHYRMPHRAADWLGRFTCGIPEINRARLCEATHVAAGGCFATAAILSLHPLRELAAGTVVIDGKTGSSGAGATPTERTHHPHRAGSFFAYEPFHHRHAPEIEQATGLQVLFQPHSAPMVRGVFTTSYVPLARDMSTEEVLEIFRRAYAGAKFVRLGAGSPNVNHVKGSNFVDIGVTVEGRIAVVFAALDNLVKGGAGQGVQCLNLMFGLPEETGLAAAPARP